MTHEWIDTAGGPLIALSRSLVPLWKGVEPSTSTSDYERACDVEGYVGLIPVGSGHGLVLGDEPAPTCFVPEPRGGLFARWLFAESAEEVASRLERAPTEGFERESCSLAVGAEPWLVFDAACVGSELDAALTIDLAPGPYELSTLVWEPDEDTCLLLHRLGREVG